MMSLVFDREYFRRPLNWLILAGLLVAAICLTYNVFAYSHGHRQTLWFFVGIGLLLASQLTSIATRRTRRK
jgi:hypothetical protein